MVRYDCRHCGRCIGIYPGAWDEPGLGLVNLSEEDQQAMIKFHQGSEDVSVEILCERCLPMPLEDRPWYN